MSHVKFMNESSHIHECVMLHVWMSHLTYIPSQCDMSYVWMSYLTYINELCHLYERGIYIHQCDMSYIGMSHVTYIHESCHILNELWALRPMHHGTAINPPKKKGVTSHSRPPKKRKRYMGTYINMSVKSRADVSRNHNSPIKKRWCYVTVKHQIYMFIWAHMSMSLRAREPMHQRAARSTSDCHCHPNWGKKHGYRACFGFC